MEMTAAKYAQYLRVSTQKQGIDGYGVEAQRGAITVYRPAECGGVYRGGIR